MQNFILKWLNIAVLANPNSLKQRVLYREKSDGGDFISTGFTPAGDLPKYATTASVNLEANIVYEFKVQNISGETEADVCDNDNGIVERLKFQCLVPVMTHTVKSASAVLNVTGTDITKARFTLKKLSDDSVVYGPVLKNVAGNSISATTGDILTGSTSYYWATELYATVADTEIVSSASSPIGLGSLCNSASFTTDADICAPVTAVTVTSIEVV